MIKDIAADPKTASTQSGVGVTVKLSGHDSGGGNLTYKVTRQPLYGKLSGTAPNLTYTPDTQFVGQDQFAYVVNNGTVDSDPAKVYLNVAANPADKTPPEVIATYPDNSATQVTVDPINPVAITATFSKPLDQATVVDASMSVTGLTGKVFYDPTTRTVTFMPTKPFATGTVYTATIYKTIQDPAGNAMTADYVWTFTTVKPVAIGVVGPDDSSQAQFPNTAVGSAAEALIVNVNSLGTKALNVGTVGLTETSANARGATQKIQGFSITQDNCSGQALAPTENCTIAVGFAPDSAGAKAADLVIPSDDPDHPQYAFSLSGNATSGAVPGDDPGGGGGCFIEVTK